MFIFSDDQSLPKDTGSQNCKVGSVPNISSAKGVESVRQPCGRSKKKGFRQKILVMPTMLTQIEKYKCRLSRFN